jgi:O-antigen/teichoic acid export membrane protein
VLLFVLGYFAARWLPVDEWGIYRTALAFVTLFRLLPDLGMSYASTLSISRDRSLATSFVGNILGLQCVLSLVTLGLALSIGGWLYEGAIWWAVVVLTVDLLLKSVKFTFRWLLKAFERFGSEAVSLLAERLALLVGGLMALSLGGGVMAFVLVFAVVRLIDTSALAAYVVRRVSPVLPRWEPRLWLDLARRGLPFAYAGAMVMIFFAIDQVLLKQFKGEKEVGYYATPVLLLEGLSLVPRIFGYALIPTMAALHLSAPEALTALYRRAAKYLLVLAMPVVAFGLIAAEPFVRLLFGEKYLPSVGLTSILLSCVVFMFLSNLAETTLACINRWRVVVFAATAAAVLNIVLNLIWIPPHGAFGAAWATLATNVFYLAATALPLARHGHSVPWLSTTARPLLATAVFATVLWAAGAWPIWLSSSLAAGAFLLATFALGIWDARERALVATFLQGLVPRRAATQ